MHITIFRQLLCILFLLGTTLVSGQERERLDKVTAPELNEISGIVPAAFSDSLFWVHNDSGDRARIFLIDQQGVLRCEVRFEGQHFVDVEDIAWLRKNGKYHLLIGDIGDNQAKRSFVSFYLVEEPIWDGVSKLITIGSQYVIRFDMKYPDKPRDAEAFFVDPRSNELILLSKRDIQSQVFSSDILIRPSKNAVFRHESSLPLFFITAADISHNGNEILAKNLTTIYHWEVKSGETIKQTFGKIPTQIPYKAEPQGESICFDKNGNVFYTISERPFGLDSYLYRYQLRIK